MEKITNEETQTSGSNDGKGKKTVIRSVAYPGMTLEEVTAFVTKLYKTYPNTTITRDDAAAIIENSGYLNRTLSAGVQYGLLSLESGEGYKITEAFLPFYQSLNENEKIEARINALSSPKLYQTLIQNYDGHALPAELPTILFRKHGIAEKASHHCANIFIENSKYSGVLDENKVLRVKQTLEKLSGTPFVEVVPEVKIENQNKNTTVVLQNQDQKHNSNLQLPSDFNGHEDDELKIRVTGRKIVRIIYPLSLTKSDIEIIKEQLKVLEKLIDAEKEGAT